MPQGSDKQFLYLKILLTTSYNYNSLWARQLSSIMHIYWGKEDNISLLKSSLYKEQKYLIIALKLFYNNNITLLLTISVLK